MRRWLVLVAACALLFLLFRKVEERRAKPDVAPTASTAPTEVALAPISAPVSHLVEGFVIDEKGHAIAGARACARRTALDLSDDERRAVCVDVGDDGRFSFTAIDTLEIVASARGHLPGKSIAQTPDHPIEIVLIHGGATITGKVLDPLDRPVAGAHVKADGAEATTGTDGTFELFTTPGIVTLEVNAEGYADHEEQAIGPSERVGVTLEWGSTIVGRATPYATVSTVLDGVGERVVRADPSGAFRIAGLRAGSYSIEARAPGKYGLSSAVALGPGEVSNEIVIAMEDAADVLVTVAGCSSGTATLHGQDSGGSIVRGTVTAGLARIHAVRPGHYEARVTCETAVVRGFRFVTVGPEGASVAFETTPGFPVSGIVTDTNGRPLPFAIVEASRCGPAKVTADRYGRFRFAALAGLCSLSADHLDGLTVGRSISVKMPIEDVRIELDVGGTVAGRALDPDGKPVADLRIDAGGTVARTSLDGRFVLAHVHTGEVTLEASRGDRRLGMATVAVDEGKTYTQDIVVERENETLTGRVVDDQGAPIAEARIELSVTQGVPFYADPSIRAMTDGDGRFSIARLPHGTFCVRASHRGFGTMTSSAEPGTAVAIQLAKASSVVASVELTTGGAAHGGYAWLTCWPNAHASSPIALDGSVAFDDVAPGSCQLEVHAASGFEKHTFELKSGEIARPVVRIEPYAFLEGRVLDSPNAVVVAIPDKDEEKHQGTRTDLDGRFSLPLRPGTWTIATERGAIIARDLALAAGQRLVLPLFTPAPIE